MDEGGELACRGRLREGEEGCESSVKRAMRFMRLG